jgi:hypothetical protein
VSDDRSTMRPAHRPPSHHLANTGHAKQTRSAGRHLLRVASFHGRGVGLADAMQAAHCGVYPARTSSAFKTHRIPANTCAGDSQSASMPEIFHARPRTLVFHRLSLSASCRPSAMYERQHLVRIHDLLPEAAPLTPAASSRRPSA